MSAAYAGDITPSDAWKLLANDQRAVLVDVRTPAEWAYVGVPDLTALAKQAVFIPWIIFPSMQINAEFPLQLAAAGVGPDAPTLFLCRSGVRSRSAAIAMTERGYQTCYNVAHGFEGDHDGNRHRGTVSGWKVEGLPWMQS
jgi:rhodanese-related sulfurtransferase